MESNGPRNPQLASILQNLAQFTRPPASAPAPFHSLENNASATASTTSQTRPSAPPTQDPRRRPTTPQPDSSTITDWPPAVKYVTLTLSKNDQVCAKIRRLIQNQHDNERQWWAGRQALIAKHQARVESKKKADDLLRSLGAALPNRPSAGEASSSSSSSTAEEEKAELQRYDQKVHVALGKMAAAMDRELTALKVPFFAIRHELVREENKDGQVSKRELIELQRKMLEHLQCLFGD